jgi:hypothetical protein
MYTVGCHKFNVAKSPAVTDWTLVIGEDTPLVDDLSPPHTPAD